VDDCAGAGFRDDTGMVRETLELSGMCETEVLTIYNGGSRMLLIIEIMLIGLGWRVCFVREKDSLVVS